MIEIKLGIYEKALPDSRDWSEKFSAVAKCECNFIELSIDPSQERLARLNWSDSVRQEVRQAAKEHGIGIQTLILSAHRSIPLGSSNPKIRSQANTILEKTIQLASDLDVSIVQLAGYFVFEEPHTKNSESWFMEGLQNGIRKAEELGIVLGLENMDGQDVLSVETALQICRKIDSRFLKVYPDVGNLAANGFNVCEQLKLGIDKFVGIHLKDTKLGVFRRIPFGEGIVPFEDVFVTLHELNYEGSYTLEMWNDQKPNSLEIVADSRQWILEKMSAAEHSYQVGARK